MAIIIRETQKANKCFIITEPSLALHGKSFQFTTKGFTVVYNYFPRGSSTEITQTQILGKNKNYSRPYSNNTMKYCWKTASMKGELPLYKAQKMGLTVINSNWNGSWSIGPNVVGMLNHTEMRDISNTHAAPRVQPCLHISHHFKVLCCSAQYK